MEQTRNELKGKFKKGDKPTEVDYANLIDSFLNIEEDPYVESLPEATTTTTGIVRAATLTEVDNATDKRKYVTPEGVKRAVSKFAPKPPVTSVNGQTGEVTIPDYTQDESVWETISLSSGISKIGTYNPRYKKKLGIVFLEGELRISSSTSGNTSLFTLKSGYRPSRTIIFYTTGSTGTMVRIQINTGGVVTATNISSAINISISGISFLAA